MERNPLAWMIEVNGLIVDARHLPGSPGSRLPAGADPLSREIRPTRSMTQTRCSWPSACKLGPAGHENQERPGKDCRAGHSGGPSGTSRACSTKGDVSVSMGESWRSEAPAARIGIWATARHECWSRWDGQPSGPSDEGSRRARVRPEKPDGDGRGPIPARLVPFPCGGSRAGLAAEGRCLPDAGRLAGQARAGRRRARGRPGRRARGSAVGSGYAPGRPATGMPDCHRLEIDYSRFERMLDLPGLSESAEIACLTATACYWYGSRRRSGRDE